MLLLNGLIVLPYDQFAADWYAIESNQTLDQVIYELFSDSLLDIFDFGDNLFLRKPIKQTYYEIEIDIPKNHRLN